MWESWLTKITEPVLSDYSTFGPNANMITYCFLNSLASCGWDTNSIKYLCCYTWFPLCVDRASVSFLFPCHSCTRFPLIISSGSFVDVYPCLSIFAPNFSLFIAVFFCSPPAYNDLLSMQFPLCDLLISLKYSVKSLSLCIWVLSKLKHYIQL